jgi:hypothetical protein
MVFYERQKEYRWRLLLVHHVPDGCVLRAAYGAAKLSKNASLSVLPFLPSA